MTSRLATVTDDQTSGTSHAALIATAPLSVQELRNFDEPGERVRDDVQNMPAMLVLIEEVPTTSERLRRLFASEPGAVIQSSPADRIVAKFSS